MPISSWLLDERVEGEETKEGEGEGEGEGRRCGGGRTPVGGVRLMVPTVPLLVAG